jgi:AAA+ ATPase superfamily predicted ATPase
MIPRWYAGSVFVNRVQELEDLDRWWGSRGTALGVVWGRRRVGKSMLLRHWVKGKRSVFHVARNRPEIEELRSLSHSVAQLAVPMRRDLLARPFRDWDDVFDVLSDMSASEPLVLVIDEFPELLKLSNDLESALRSIWERVEGTCQLRVVLCGSSTKVMEAIQLQSAPLFNRMTLRLQVHPFRVSEVAKMLPAASPMERAAAWGVCGGLPFYLARWDDTTSFRENINDLFCSESSMLLSEGELVLATEDLVGAGGERLPERVLRTIADGHTSFSDIRNAITTLPTRSLAELERNRLITKVVPVTAPRSKLTYYRIADNFLAFWLSVIEPHRPAIEQGLGPSVLPVIIASFDDYMGVRWEEAVREHVRIAASAGRICDDVVAVGEFWRTKIGPTEDPCQLDLVALVGRSRKVGVVGEIKWSKRKSARPLVSEIQRKAAEAKLDLIADPLWVVAARQELTDIPERVLALTAADIFP